MHRLQPVLFVLLLFAPNYNVEIETSFHLKVKLVFADQNGLELEQYLLLKCDVFDHDDQENHKDNLSDNGHFAMYRKKQDDYFSVADKFVFLFLVRIRKTNCHPIHTSAKMITPEKEISIKFSLVE